MWDDYDFGGGNYSWDNTDWDASVGDITQDLTGGDSSWWDSVSNWGGGLTDAISNWDFGSTTGDVTGSLSDYMNWNDPWNTYGNDNMTMSNPTDPYANLPVETSYGDMAYGNPTSGSITNTLSNIFNTIGTNKNAQNLLGKGVAALLAGKQNTAAAKSYQNLANSATVDPFGAQRAQYQAQLSQGYANPNSITAVKQNMDALARAQAIKDAAAGRRSNTATSSPGLLLAQQQAQQNYLKNLASLAGANISPNTGAAANAMSQAIQSGTSGYTSPLMYLLGASNTPTTTSANNQAGGVNPQSTTGIQDLIGLFS